MRRLTFVFALLAFACGGDSTGPDTNIAGAYSLRTVNGANLPFVLEQVGADKVELTADVFTFTDTGTFTQITTLRSTENGQVTTGTIPDAGSYTRSGTAITVAFLSGSPTVTGTIGGGTFTIAAGGYSGVYRK